MLVIVAVVAIHLLTIAAATALCVHGTNNMMLFMVLMPWSCSGAGGELCFTLGDYSQSNGQDLRGRHLDIREQIGRNSQVGLLTFPAFVPANFYFFSSDLS